MNLDSFKSLENELTKNSPAFYKELLKTWITCRGGGGIKVHTILEK
jgi:hypothetical protein